MIELNADFRMYRKSDNRAVYMELKIPKAYEADFLMLKDNLKAKRLSQVHVKVSRPRKPRTTGEFSQNHRLNGFIQQISAYTGDYFDDCKKHIKKQAISMGYPFHTDSFGNVVPQSESEASTQECAILIECTQMIASDMGIVLRES
jgi:hypothetical protein